MDNLFSDRISDVPKSFIREILKTTINEDVISFAGGLPNRDFFPVEAVKAASAKVLDEAGPEVLQYSTTEGYLPLRTWISNRYKERSGMDIDPNNIIITTGSQQGLDLMGKVLINEGDDIGIEEPGYLGAIQAFSLYRPKFKSVPLTFEGLDNDALEETLKENFVKLFYSVPCFQNPSGITHSDEKRRESAKIISKYKTVFIEDNPYGELQFTEEKKQSYFSMIPSQTVLLGSFSKIFAPSFRIGWIVAPDYLTEKLIIAKQAADLHTNYFVQRILYQYLQDNDINIHIDEIRKKYLSQKNAMVGAIQKFFPEEIKFVDPDGGMFLWVVLPEKLSAKKLFYKSMEKNIAFVPGDPFYVNKSDVNTMRLNFSSVDEDTIEKGISILGNIIKEEISQI